MRDLILQEREWEEGKKGKRGRAPRPPQVSPQGAVFITLALAFGFGVAYPRAVQFATAAGPR